MLEVILPSTMVGLLAAFEPCSHAPTYRVFQVVLAGWMHCLGRRTRTSPDDHPRARFIFNSRKMKSHCKTCIKEACFGSADFWVVSIWTVHV